MHQGALTQASALLAPLFEDLESSPAGMAARVCLLYLDVLCACRQLAQAEGTPALHWPFCGGLCRAQRDLMNGSPGPLLESCRVDMMHLCGRHPLPCTLYKTASQQHTFAAWQQCIRR